MSQAIFVHGKIRVQGPVVFGENRTDFPETPSAGEMILKDNGLFAYINVGGILTWYPLVKAPDSYQHTQGLPAMEWVVNHALNSSNVFYQVQDANGQVMNPSSVTLTDNNTMRLVFSEAVTGVALIMTIGGERGAAGERGVDGESAFQIAQRLGYVGTEADWLLSLKGEQGIQGIPGEPGQPGEQGLQGPAGGDAAFLDWELVNTPGTVTFSRETAAHQRIQVGAPLTFEFTDWPVGEFTGELMLEIVNGAAFTLTWPVVNWLKSDGTYVTNFALSDSPLKTSGIDFVLLRTSDNGVTIYGKVMR